MTTIVMRAKVKTTKARKALYWASTILAAFALGASGAADLVRVPDVAEGIARLGYPAYFPMILGTWKLLGSIAIIIPGLSRLKEWAFAGIFFTLTGAAISHAIVGDPAGKILIPLTILTVVMTSRALQSARGISDQEIASTQHAAILAVATERLGRHGR